MNKRSRGLRVWNENYFYLKFFKEVESISDLMFVGGCFLVERRIYGNSSVL